MTKTQTDNSELIDKVVEFAQSKDRILAAYEGNDPEDEKHTVYYFLIGKSTHDPTFEDEITEFDISLAREGYRCDFLAFPMFPKDVENHRFIKKQIYLRNS